MNMPGLSSSARTTRHWEFFLVHSMQVLCQPRLCKGDHASLTHGAEPFLRSRQLCSYSRTSQHFMECEGSLPCSQEPSTGPYPEPDQSSPYHFTTSLSTHLRLGLPSGLFLSGFPTNILYAFLFSPFVLHAQPTSSPLTWTIQKMKKRKKIWILVLPVKHQVYFLCRQLPVFATEFVFCFVLVHRESLKWEMLFYSLTFTLSYLVLSYWVLHTKVKLPPCLTN
jgi:hypothetical protein